VVLLAIGSGACGEDRAGIPAGCRAGADALRTALKRAPAPVHLEGTPLSECLSDTSGGGDLLEVGTAYIDVASQLADDARADRDGRAAVQLGYLVGAAERGERGAQGVGYELGRRLRAEAARGGASAAFRRGRRAGRAGG